MATYSTAAELRKATTNQLGEAYYNNTNIFDFGQSIGMDINSINTIRTDTTTTRSKNWGGIGLATFAGGTVGGVAAFISQDTKTAGSNGSTTTTSYAYDEAQLKSYYEAFTTVEKTRKAQLQAFGKEQATVSGQTFASPAPVSSTASQSILGQ